MPSESVAAAIELTIPDAVKSTENVNVSEVKIVCGTFNNTTSTSGTLSLTKNAAGDRLTVALDARNRSRLRIAYTGAFASSYESANTVKVTMGEESKEAAFAQLFNYRASTTNNFAFGMVKASTPAELTNGNYAVSLTLSDQNIGSTIDLAKEAGKCGLVVYDYRNRTTYDLAKVKGVTGTIATQGTVDKLYLAVSFEFPEGPKVEGEWYGNTTSATEFHLFKSSNTIKATMGAESEQAALSQVFNHRVSSLGNNFAFGMVKATTPADLMEGKYAVKLGLSDLNIGSTIDLAKESSKCELTVYDYQTYKSYKINSIEGVTGKIITDGTADKLYLWFNITIPEGPSIEGEWYGDVTAVEEFDIVPVAPFTPYIKITKPDGTVLLEKTIGSMEMRMQSNFSLRGGDPAYGGAKFDAFFFYFRPEGNTSGIETSSAIPQFMIATSYLNSTDLNLASGEADLHWNFKYGAENTIQYGSGGYSETYTMYGSVNGYCPTEVQATIVRNADKTWNIKYTMVDSGVGTWSSWGYKNILTLEWRGVATKYTGTKTNNYPDSDY